MFMAYLGLLFIEWVLALSTFQIYILLAIVLGVGLILKDVNGVLMPLFALVVTGLVGALAKVLIKGWLIFAIFGYVLYIVMDGTVIYLLVCGIRHLIRASKH